MGSIGSDAGSGWGGSSELIPLQDSPVGCGTNVERCWLQGKEGVHRCFWIGPTLLGPGPCWGEFEAPRWSSWGQLESPPSRDNKCQLKRFRFREIKIRGKCLSGTDE